MLKFKVSYLTLYYVQFDYSKAFDKLKRKSPNECNCSNCVFNCGLLE